MITFNEFMAKKLLEAESQWGPHGPGMENLRKKNNRPKPSQPEPDNDFWIKRGEAKVKRQARLDLDVGPQQKIPD